MEVQKSVDRAKHMKVENLVGRGEKHYCFTCKRNVYAGPEKQAHEINNHNVDQCSQEYYQTVEDESGVRP